MTPPQVRAMKLSDDEIRDDESERQDQSGGPAGTVTRLFPGDPIPQSAAHLRMVEAILFAAVEPLDEASIAERMPPDADIPKLLQELAEVYAKRGVNLVKVAGRWMFRTAPDLAHLLQKNAIEQKRLSRAAMETLAIIAYHQPVTRAEIEEIRGVTINTGTLDILLEVGWIKMRGRRRVPGRPVTYGTSDDFLMHFGLDKVSDLPGLEELRAAGLMEGRIPASFNVPSPSDSLAMDEDPLEAGDDGDLFEAEEAEPKGDKSAE
jgi:segregation and condensation protein B